MSADNVGVVRSTAEKGAERYAKDRCVGRPRGDTVSRTKEKEPAGNTKKDESGKKIEKT